MSRYMPSNKDLKSADLKALLDEMNGVLGSDRINHFLSLARNYRYLLAETSLADLYHYLESFSSEAKVKVTANGKQLYVGSGIINGGDVRIYLPKSHHIVFLDDNRPLPFDIQEGGYSGCGIVPNEEGLVRFYINNTNEYEYYNQVRFLRFSVMKSGCALPQGNELRLAVWNKGDVSGISFDLRKPGEWKHKVLIKAPGAREEDVKIAREIFRPAIAENLQSDYENLKDLDVDVSFGENFHFGTEQREVPLKHAATLSWPNQ